MSTSELRVMTNMRMFGRSALSFDQIDSFPLNPFPGQFALVEGILYIYSKIGVTQTWFPLTNKKSSHVHFQSTPAFEWTVSHNYNTDEYVFMVYDDNGNILHANPTPIDKNKFKLNFSHAVSGKVVVFIHSDLAIPRLATEDGIIEMLTVNQIISVAQGKVTADSNGLMVDGTDVGTTLTDHAQHIDSFNGMFTADFDHTKVIKDLLPNTDQETLGRADHPFAQVHAATISANSVDTRSQSEDPDTQQGKLLANQVDIQARTTSAGVAPAQIILTGSNKTQYLLRYDEATGQLKLIDETGAPLEINGQAFTGARIDVVHGALENLNVSANTVLGSGAANSAEINATTTFNAPVSFSEHASIGNGDDNVNINCGAEQLLTVISKFFNLNSEGKLTVKNLVVSENLDVAGTRTETSSTNVTSGEQFITLLAGTTDEPTLDAGLKITRGNSANAAILWDETLNAWTLGVDGDMRAIVRTDDLRLLTEQQHQQLTTGESTHLHYHEADRDRANHTGTQTAQTISDFAQAVAQTQSVQSKVDNVPGKGLSTHDLTDELIDKINSALQSVKMADIADLPDLSGVGPHPSDDFTHVEVANLRSGKTATGETMHKTLVFGGDEPPPNTDAGINDIWFNTAGDATVVERKTAEGFQPIVTIASEMNMQHSDVEYVMSASIKEYIFKVNGEPLTLKPKFLTVYLNRKLLRKSEYTINGTQSITLNIDLSVDDEIEVVTA
ncbi:hypothetical protein EAG18_08615 [Pseudoalteromonas sp. J010]|uniref:hypothetical protein n=1 Tax=Pseudoalteromonas sp. J010 TaxID=998465 RepID=UPI000F6513BA|nr:hypothetical protein [Pseudoalteromonas sp. J010]RRS09173.1 hypothetical protein EAG18_08615 [Pseudoalteromonas sp. J010]